MRRFAGFHPSVVMLFYISAIIPAMFVSDPGLVLVSWFAGMLWISVLRGRFPAGQLVFTLGAVSVMAFVNALVSHDGAAELLFINGKAVTLEAVLYGALTGLMLAAAMVWFSSFSDIMTGDRIIALMGRLPKLGLALSMVLRLVPEYTARFKKMKTAADINGSDGSKGSRGGRRRRDSGGPGEYMGLVSAVFTWALENSMQTAASMERRGYAAGKKRYSPYRFGPRDGAMLAVIIILQARYFLPHGWAAALTALNCALPVIYEGKEQLKWALFKLTR